MSVGSKKLEYINAVRGIAILLVIILQVSRAVVDDMSDTFNYICAKGSYGVQLFFVASAFTLYISYNSRSKSEGEYTDRNFFIRRFFRISPMYYLAALVYAVICYFVPRYNDNQALVIWKVVVNVFYINNLIPGTINYLPPGGWSVSVKMLFYLCLPFLFRKIRNFRAAVTWFLAITLASFILKLTIRYLLIQLSIDYQNPENWFLYFWFPNQAPVFFLGFALYFAIQKYRIQTAVNAYTALILSMLLMCSISRFMPEIDPYHILPEHIIVSVFFAVNIFLMSQYDFKIFNNKFTRFLGEISFSLYLVHFIVVYVLADYFPLPSDPYPKYFTLLALTIVISSIISKFTYEVIEVKGMKFGNSYTKSKTPDPKLNPAI